MRAIERRLGSLEKRAGIDGVQQVKTIIRLIVTPDDVKSGRPGWLGAISILGTRGKIDGMRFVRGEDEDKRAFLARAGEGYRAIHGPLPGDWFGREAA